MTVTMFKSETLEDKKARLTLLLREIELQTLNEEISLLEEGNNAGLQGSVKSLNGDERSQTSIFEIVDGTKINATAGHTSGTSESPIQSETFRSLNSSHSTALMSLLIKEIAELRSRLAAALGNCTWKGESEVQFHNNNNHLEALLQTRIDEGIAKGLDEYFEEANSWIWKTEARVQSYVDAEVDKALANHFKPSNSYVWKKNAEIRKYVDEEVGMALGRYLDDVSNWKDDERIKSYLVKEIEAVLKTERAAMEPLLKVGRAVRNAHIEMHVGVGQQRDEKIIEAGIDAMHDSRPTADATLYLESTANRRTDNSTFRHMYGVDWTTFWKLKTCTPFAHLAQMHGSVKFWHPNDFFETGFFKALPKKFGLFFNKMDLPEVREYFNNQNNKAMVHELREWISEERSSQRSGQVKKKGTPSISYLV